MPVRAAQQNQLSVADLQVRQAADLASVETLASWVTPGACTGLAVRAVLDSVCSTARSCFKSLSGLSNKARDMW